jgi:YD repeat-containing protein
MRYIIADICSKLPSNSKSSIGLWRSEQVALTWRDIDLEPMQVNVHRSCARKRLIKTTYPDTTTVTNTYDGPGNLASIRDQAGNVVQYAYDAANQGDNSGSSLLYPRNTGLCRQC